MRKILTSLLLAVVLTANAQHTRQAIMELSFPVDRGIGGTTFISYKGQTIVPTFNDNKEASVMLPCDSFAYCWLTYQRRRIPLYIEGGKLVKVSNYLDGNDLKMRIEGDNTDINAFINGTKTISAGENEYALIYSHFKDALKRIYIKNDSIVAQADLPDGYKEKEKERLELQKRLCVAAYYTFHNRILEERHIDSPSSTIPQDYYQDLESILADNDQLLIYPDYIDFNRLAVLAIVQNNKKGITQSQVISDYAQYVVSHFHSPVTRQILLNEVITPYINSQGIEGMEEVDRIYHSNVTDSDMLASYLKAYEKWSRLLPGQPFPDFSFKDANGKAFTKEDLKGKVVYMDLWATWCPPCCAEIPYMNRLAKEFSQDNGIAFLSISIDKDADAWKKKVEEKHMEGIQLLAGPDCFLMEYTNKTAIPHYIIINKDGSFVNADAPRPSDPRTIELLKECMK
ncbi:MAG: TlpA family protein disulfide reductase [Prevotella sp.]|nr:TlpA family protein disulfide reductase [Prevotella sp.]